MNSSKIALGSLCVATGLFFSTMHAGGPLERLPNTTLTNLPSALPTFGFTASNAFPAMPPFQNPVCIAAPPGETNRLFVVEKSGLIVVVTNLVAPTRSVFLDITSSVQADSRWYGEQGLLGLAFHPGFATN